MHYQTPREELQKVIGHYDGIVLRSRIRMDQAFLQHAVNLKFIGRPGAGLENIDLDYCTTRQIAVFRSPEGNRDAVAEHAMGMLLSLFNHLKRADEEVRSGVWKREENRGHELMGKTVGILGYGYMGEAFSKRLLGFGVKVIAYDKYKSNFSNKWVNEVDLNTLFQETDVLSIHIPQSPETIGMIDAAFLNSFQKPIYLINTARGKSVVTKDVVQAINKGQVIGACLDVLEYEQASFEQLVASELPPDFQALLHSDRVILSPHIAGWTHEAKLKMAQFLANKIIAHFAESSV